MKCKNCNHELSYSEIDGKITYHHLHESRYGQCIYHIRGKPKLCGCTKPEPND